MLQLSACKRRERVHPINYWGWRYVKEEMHKRKSQRMQSMFSSNLAAPDVSFAVVLWGSTEQQQWPQTHGVEVAGSVKMEGSLCPYTNMNSKQWVGQSVSQGLKCEQFPSRKYVENSMAVYNRIQWCCVREGEKVDITRTVLNFTKQNDHQNS